tara:strand:+ start:1746 stop:2861 length:1116 start_codon:yes stop_codon:yes gene_type:complete
MGKKAIVTGSTGQDGSYLIELLISKDYDVIGLKRRTSTSTLDRISHIESDKLKVEEFEISDSGSVYSAVEKHKPDEIYNLAAQSHVKTSFDQPEYTFQVNTVGVINFLEAIRRFSPDTKFYQASTSEMFGKSVSREKKSAWGDEWSLYQDEHTIFEPQSPYAAAKLASHHLVRNYREGYDIFGACGILFNHESERRGENFVTRKITKWIAEFVRWAEVQGLDASQGSFNFEGDLISSGRDSFPKLRLGNVDAYRDWGHAEDYVNAMWLMLQQQKPDDYVIATGETYSVREFLSEAFQYIGVSNYEDYFVIDPEFYRPSEVEYLKGKPSKAEDELGWTRGVSFSQLVRRMVESDINAEEKKKRSIQRVKFIP